VNPVQSAARGLAIIITMDRKTLHSALFRQAPGGSAFHAGRRRFLCAAGAAVVTLSPLGAAWARTRERRFLSFVHTHTGESLSVDYFREGAYDPSALERVNHLLRDFRTEQVHPIDPSLLDILFDLQTLAEHERPFEVISGYRSPQTNTALRRRSHGVAEHSLHLQGRAIDVRLPGFATRGLRELALGMQRGGVGFYARSDFVHLDNGPVRFW
jgi:uncharacterized protein YcbK (DUF882 family)